LVNWFSWPNAMSNRNGKASVSRKGNRNGSTKNQPGTWMLTTPNKSLVADVLAHAAQLKR